MIPEIKYGRSDTTVVALNYFMGNVNVFQGFVKAKQNAWFWDYAPKTDNKNITPVVY